MATQQTITDYHAKLYAYQLTQRVNGDSPERIAASMMDSSVDLNPHQIDAALFAFQSPLSKGVILADEVGLGKTIEAGLVISQVWAERSRRILIITPASLRKQWEAELQQKFHLPTMILEGASFNAVQRRDATANPFMQDGERIVICSLPFASSKHEYIERIPWDLVVVDEAHHLRSHDSVRHKHIKQSVHAQKLLLLTATPLQNRLEELWSLTSLIDEHHFGERAAFRKRYSTPLSDDQFTSLRERLSPLVQRTLRRQAREFIRFTNRIPMVREFTPTLAELELYDEVTAFILESSYALPRAQRHLMMMVLQKLQASSTFAISSALRTIATRLQRQLAAAPSSDLTDDLADDVDELDEVMEEWEVQAGPLAEPVLSGQDRIAIQRELDKIETMAAKAERITHNAKMDALKSGLREAFRKMDQLGAPRKALIFTESRRTQQYILRELGKEPEFMQGIMTFDGSNSDRASTEIYNQWRAKHAGSDRVTGTRSADMRAALVDYFRDEASIMIATEAAAEGVNLQFCSLVINYDLPWNPQRVEQRIGRCHRYGQNFDVVVLNFLNKENAADQRVYELLSEKFHLFSGVFGSSDEVLGSIGSGVDFEKAVAQIYRTARSKAEIDASFNKMQLDFFDVIENQRLITEQKLLENFDENVAERFRIRSNQLDSALDRNERAFMALTLHELGSHAHAIDSRTFELLRTYSPAPPGTYQLVARKGAPTSDGHIYRLSHPLAEHLISSARDRDLSSAEVHIELSHYPGRLSSLEKLPVKSGWLSAAHLAITMDAGDEDHLLLYAIDDSGNALDAGQIGDLLRVGASINGAVDVSTNITQSMSDGIGNERVSVIEALDTRIDEWLNLEEAKLDAWTEDRKVNIEMKIKDVESKIDTLQRELRLRGGSAKEKLEKRREIDDLREVSYDLEEKNREARREIREARREMLDQAYERIHKQTTEIPLFTIRWVIT